MWISAPASRLEHMTKRTFLVAALCALAATPALTHAGTAYRVDAAGTGSYKLSIDLSTPGSVETGTVDASFSWTSFIAAVTFDDAGRLIGIAEQPPDPTKLSGQLTRTIDVVSDSAPDRAIHTSCNGADVVDTPMTTTSLQRVGDDPYALSFTPFERVEFADHRCSDGSAGAFGIFDDEHDPHALWQPADGMSPFEQRFELPREAIGSGRIVQFVKPQAGQTIPARCPGYSQATGEKCTAAMQWSGSITFTKIDDASPVAPLVPPPAQPTRFDGPAAVEDLLAPLVPLKAKVGKGAKTVSFTASCPSGCTGTAAVSAVGRARAAKARKKLRFKVAAGAPRTVRLRLPAAVRRKLRGARRARLAVTMRAPGAAPKRTTLTLPLHRKDSSGRR
jgi:hypothetical protein